MKTTLALLALLLVACGSSAHPPADADPDAQVALAVDTTGFADLYGPQAAERFGLVLLPDCVLTSPDSGDCAAEGGTTTMSVKAAAEDKAERLPSSVEVVPAKKAPTKSKAAAKAPARKILTGSVPVANLLGEEGKGFKIAMFSLENGRYTVASGATGVIRASRDASVAYANTREVQGQTIANFQLVKQKIAEMEADYEMCRLLWLKAGYLKNEGKPSTKAASLAKWQATVRSEKAASMAIEVHGANGYTNDYPVERYLRNCKAAVIYEGTRDIHTLMQADWALGLKKEKQARVILPPYEPEGAKSTAG